MIDVDRFFGKNRRFDSISISIFPPAADCFDYARVYKHPGTPEAFVRCTVAAAPCRRHRRATYVGLSGW